jgi:hypothetical protein
MISFSYKTSAILISLSLPLGKKNHYKKKGTRLALLQANSMAQKKLQIGASKVAIDTSKKRDKLQCKGRLKLSQQNESKQQKEKKTQHNFKFLNMKLVKQRE